MNIEFVYLILSGVDKLMRNQELIDSISRRRNQLLNAQLQAHEKGQDVNFDQIARLKLIKQGRKTVTIEKRAMSTKFTIHDVNFENIDDWNVF